jgi:hypothetical protein
MLTTLDKAIVAVLLPLLIWGNQKWGLTLPVDADTWLPIVAAIGGVLVYVIPNKTGGVKLDDKGGIRLVPALVLGGIALAILLMAEVAPQFGWLPVLIVAGLNLTVVLFIWADGWSARSVLTCSTVGVVGVLLCGCAGVQTKVDETLQNQNVQTGIQLACATFTGVSAGWDVYAADHHVSNDATKAVVAAKAAVGTICTPPYPTDTATLIAAVTHAGVAVMTALQDAQHAESAAVE